MTGLTTSEVEERRARGEGETGARSVTKSTGAILRENICTLFNALNFAIAILLFAVGAYSNMLFIAIIILNIVIGIVQEFKAKKLVDELTILNQPHAVVLRDGKETTIEAGDIVKDDVMVLDSGKQICNDAVVIDGRLEVNESLLTGESDSIDKTAGSELYSGSSVISGRAYARVTHVGDENYTNSLINEVRQEKRVHSELLDSMRKVTRFTSFLIIPLGVLLFVEAMFLRHSGTYDAVVSSAAALLGMLISMIGMDPLSGNLRMTFDSPDLINGVSLVPALVGLYALSQVLVTIEDVFMGRKLSTAEISRKGISLPDLWANRAALIRGSLFGTFIGIVPATGSGTASFAAYSETKRHSKHPELFGKGTLEGIAATESANNAVTGGALIPLLTLGVPGDVVTAIMLGALMIQGMTPGPLLFQEQGTLVYSIFIALFVSNVFMLLLGYYAVRLFAKVVLIPGGILMPLVTTLCVVGGYALNNSNFDLAVMAGFGLLGYIMTKARFPLAPLLLAMILSGIIETNFRRALSISNQDFSVFFTRPVCAAFLAISLFILFNLLWKEWKKYRAASAA